ncbi:MAG: D-glycero-beta-D-manno-heptose-7-phosphate kinase, partial [Pseudomonadota bacterium]
MNISSVEKLLGKLEDVNVLVVGDIGIDSYVLGNVKRISPEAPVPIVEVYDNYNRLGLSANVASNVRALGAKCRLVGVVGDDGNAELIRKDLVKMDVGTDGLVVDKDRPTTHKTRVLASRLHHVVRIDKEDKSHISENIKNQVVARVEKLMDETDIVIIEDYGKGLLKSGVAADVISMCKKRGKHVFVDPSRHTDSLIYKNATLLKPNFDEARILSGVDIEGEKALYECGMALMKKLGLEYLVVTRGKEGMTVFTKDAEPKTIPTFALEVYDVSGAGDTVIAALSLAFSAGFNIYESAFFANTAAAIVVGKVGTSVATPTEIME